MFPRRVCYNGTCIGYIEYMLLYNVYTIQCTVYSVQCTQYTVHCILYTRPVRTKTNFTILKTFTSVKVMYAMMNKCLKC